MNLTFREPTIDDYNLVKRIWEDEETMAAVGGIQELSESRYASWYHNIIETGRDSHKYLLIFLDSNCVGEVSFHRFDSATGSAELNIKVKSKIRNRGIGKKALDHLLKIFFREWHGQKIADRLGKDNHEGYRALSAYGFSEISRDNKTVLMALLKSDYERLMNAG